VIKGFFFDGIDICGNEFSVGVGVENALFILPDVTDAELPIGDRAAVVAQETKDLPVFQFLIEKAFFQDHLSYLRFLLL